MVELKTLPFLHKDKTPELLFVIFQMSFLQPGVFDVKLGPFNLVVLVLELDNAILNQHEVFLFEIKLALRLIL